MSVAQYTSSACPPVLDFSKGDRPLCKGINDDVFEKIKLLRPEAVVLSALAHTWPLNASENPVAKLPETVRKLRQIGVKRIVLVGPVPHWATPFPTLLVRYMLQIDATETPLRMPKNRSVESMRDMNAALAGLAMELSIGYVDSYRIFCNVEGCVTTVGMGKLKDLPIWDDAHLTPTAARLVVSENMATFFH